MVEMFGLVERNGGNRPVGLRFLDQFQFEMAAIRPDLAHVAVVIDILGQEHRSVVSGTERLELFENPEKFRSNLRKVQYSVYHDDRGKHVFVDMLFYEILYPFAEFGQVLLFQGQACRIEMPAEVLQEVGTAFDCIIEVEPVDAPCRPGDKAV